MSLSLTFEGHLEALEGVLWTLKHFTEKIGWDIKVLQSPLKDGERVGGTVAKTAIAIQSYAIHIQHYSFFPFSLPRWDISKKDVLPTPWRRSHFDALAGRNRFEF